MPRPASTSMPARALVDQIAPFARATARTGAIPALGGFGGLFDLAACGFRDPVLVATTDGVGTKVLLAAEAGAHRAGRHRPGRDVRQRSGGAGRPAAVLPRLLRHRAPRSRDGARVVAGIGDGCRMAGCALIGGETAEMPGLYGRGEFDLAGFAVGAVERDAVLPRPDRIADGDLVLGLASSGIHANGYSLVRLVLREQGLELDAALPLGRAARARRRAAGADPHLRRELPRRHRGRRRQGPGPHHRRRAGREPPARARRGTGHALDARAWQLPPVFAWLAEPAGSTRWS